MANSLSSTLLTTFLVLSLFHLSSFHNNLAAKHIHHSYSSANLHHHHHHIPTPYKTTKATTNVSNPRLQQAYIALQAWKRVIFYDPNNFTSDWVGESVCNYKGVFCSNLPNATEPTITVAGIDLNFANIAGILPPELGLLSDLALIHLNSNRFCGLVPQTLSNLSLLFELDLSNNRLVGPFPTVVLSLPSLQYLDLRYNEFEGPLPPELFSKSFDAIFLNNNGFTSSIPPNLGRSSATVLVFANNNFGGCLPPSISNLADTLEELVLINTNLSGCVPPEVGFLYKLKLLDLSSNRLEGPIPYSIAGLAHLEQLNVAHNYMSGNVPEGVCILPNLVNFTYSYNFFCEEEGVCRNLTSKGVVFDDRRNCLPEKPLQRTKEQCDPVVEHPVDCYNYPCGGAPVAQALAPTHA
ncbi:hypothetical protein C3L33_10425, partial [Rhododendron williamsianum]